MNDIEKLDKKVKRLEKRVDLLKEVMDFPNDIETFIDWLEKQKYDDVGYDEGKKGYNYAIDNVIEKLKKGRE